MSEAHLRFGIPDIGLPRPGGGTVNPSAFAGHVLVVVFCPATLEREETELAEYRKLSPALSAYDGWLVTVSKHAIDEQPTEQHSTAAALDPEGGAWAEFCEIAPPELELDRSEGATFLFARGGSLERVWPGAGHASDVIEELARPCFGVEAMGASPDEKTAA